jgi:hypothetical protein
MISMAQNIASLKDLEMTALEILPVYMEIDESGSHNEALTSMTSLPRSRAVETATIRRR